MVIHFNSQKERMAFLKGEYTEIEPKLAKKEEKVAVDEKKPQKKASKRKKKEKKDDEVPAE